MPNMHKLEVRKSGIHGKGVYANEAIKKGVLIGIYHGEITEKDSTYVLWITDENGDEYGVNGTSDLKFLNHSHKPNAEFDGDQLLALRTIKPDEEITFHYGATFVEWLDGLD